MNGRVEQPENKEDSEAGGARSEALTRSGTPERAVACGRYVPGIECTDESEILKERKVCFLRRENHPVGQSCFARRVILLGGVCLIGAAMGDAQDRSQARSMAISQNGIVAAESPLAAQAGVRILESGGNAVDAAIATNAMMGVVSPMMNGIGGDLFAIVYDAKANKLYGLNASGWAPRGLTIDMLRKLGMREMPQTGVHTITVPGAVDGWQKLSDKFGRKKLSEDLAAAIRTAEEGFPVT